MEDSSLVDDFKSKLEDLSDRLSTLSWMLTILCVVFGIYVILEISTVLYTIIIKSKKSRDKKKDKGSQKGHSKKKKTKNTSKKSNKSGKSSRKQSKTSSGSSKRKNSKTNSSKAKKKVELNHSSSGQGDASAKSGKPITPVVSSGSKDEMTKDRVVSQTGTPITPRMDTPTSGVQTAVPPTPEMLKNNEMVKDYLPGELHIVKAISPVNSLIVDNTKLAPADGPGIPGAQIDPFSPSHKQIPPADNLNTRSAYSVAPTQMGSGSSNSATSGPSSNSTSITTLSSSSMSSGQPQSSAAAPQLGAPQAQQPSYPNAVVQAPSSNTLPSSQPVNTPKQ